MSKEMSEDVQKKMLLVSAAIDTLVDYEGQEKVAAFLKEIQLDSLLTDMEEYFGGGPYDTDLLYYIVKETTEELRNFKEE